MSTAVMLSHTSDAERLEDLEAAFLRSPSSEWPASTAAIAELGVQAIFEPLDGPEAWVSQYRTHTLCCKY